MSFLSTNNSEFLSARITQKGRNAIAKGSFNISYFQIGDSEFDYNLIFSGLTGNTNHQMVMSPFDKEGGIKYPYKIDDSVSSTTYGVPVNNNLPPESIRNVMGPAGFVTNMMPYDSGNGTVVKCYTEDISLSSIIGGKLLTVTNGNNFDLGNIITIVFSDFGGLDINNPVVTGKTSSLIYKIIGITGNTLEMDRNIPDLSSLTGYGQIVSNKCELEYPNGDVNCIPTPIDPIHQHNAWTLDVVWDKKPIGVNVLGDDNSLSGYTSNKHVSTKEFLGYTSTGQTFTDILGIGITNPTSYKNSFDEIINVLPEEQRCVAIIHYSELGDLVNDPERFFKYDDYISTLNTDPIYLDPDDNPLTDKDYFEVYIPFVHYHRSSSETIGAIFHMDSIDYYVKSTINNRHSLLFRYLLDEKDNKVGKVFPNNKIIVFDDQELVATLDIRSNRKYTLGAPKVSLIGSNMTKDFSLFDGTTGQTLWVTYMLSNSSFDETPSPLNSLPCNYYVKVESTNTPSNVTVRFSGETFQHMVNSFDDISHGFLAKNFYILAQLTNKDELPLSNSWKLINYTQSAGGDGLIYLTPDGLLNTTFTIGYYDYHAWAEPGLFDLDKFMGTDYTSISGVTQFGEEQPFPGSIRLVRSSDVETLNFLINLPSMQFTTTQNPTYPKLGNVDKRITEIALLDEKKEVLVMAKCPLPIKRTGTQIFSLKLDF